VKSRPPAPGRLAGHRRVERTRRLAFPIQLLFIVAVVALGGAVLFAATGGVGRVAASIGAAVAGFVSDLTATPVPTEPPVVVSDSPTLVEPTEPYTNQPMIDLVGSVPTELAGNTTSRIRIYLAIGKQDPAVLTEIAIGTTTRFLVPGVALTEGPNAFSAAIVGPAGESERSPVVTYILDSKKPKITLKSPKDGAVINAKTVKLVGLTQARSDIRARNTTTNVSVAGEADEKGAFSLILAIGAGTNAIEITATDPAGNENTLAVSFRRGSGKLAANLSASVYQIRLKELPKPIELSATITDPDGRPLPAASVTFTLAVPGVPAVASKTFQSDANGKVVWSTRIPKGATAGQITATVIVETTQFGKTTDLAFITIAK
jgi:hypothetical protein